MARERSMAAGMTDYSGYPLEDIIRHLVEWRNSTRNAIASLKKLRKQAEDSSNLLENGHDVVAYCDHFIDMLDRYAGDFQRLVDELPNGVRPKHLEIVNQLYESSRDQEKACVQFKNDWINKSLRHEEARPLLDSIYRDSRTQMVDYQDLSNVIHRLKTFVG